MGKYPKFGRRKLADAAPTGELAKRVLPNGKRAISLRTGERVELSRQRLIEGAVSRFLDLEQSWSWQAIADDLGITISMLKDLSMSPDFNDAYNQHFVELGHDPRYRRVQDELGNMLPIAIKQMRDMLDSDSTPPTVKLKVIENIMRLNGIREPKAGASDRSELTNFLKEAGLEINNTQINVGMPTDFMQDVKKYMGDSVIEGQIIEPEIVEE